MTAPLAPEYFVVGPVPSGKSCVYSGVLTQEDGVTPLAAAMLQTLVLTLFDVDTEAVINSRDEQNVLNLNGVTYDNTDGTGALSWIVSGNDNVFLRVDPPPEEGDVERHQAYFEWTFVDTNGATQQGGKRVFVLVEKYVGPIPDMGDGSVAYSDFVYRPDGVTPVPDAKVWVTSDSAGQDMVAGPVETTPLGQFLLMLNPGTYYLWVYSPSYATASQQITVA